MKVTGAEVEPLTGAEVEPLTGTQCTLCWQYVHLFSTFVKTEFVK